MITSLATSIELFDYVNAREIMKKVFMFIMLLCSAMSVEAQTETECFQYIKKLDVPSEVMALPNTDRAAFWLNLPKYNKEYQKYESALKRGKETAKSALSEINRELLYRSDIKNKLANQYVDAIVDSVNSFFNLKAYNPKMNIYIVNDKEPNAFSSPDAIILITSGLLPKIKSYKALYAVLGHELAHYALGHCVQNLYAVKKKEKRNQALAGVAFGMQAVGTAVGQALYSDNSPAGQKANAQAWQDVTNDLYKNLEWATVDAYGRYHLKYSRNQELEADIASYRFLQWIGKDPACMIQMLELIGENEPKVDPKKSDHPSTQFRINVLKAIAKYDEAIKGKKGK